MSIDHYEIGEVVLSSLGATTVVYCAVNRAQPCYVILKTVTSCCHDLSGTKTTDSRVSNFV